MRDGFVLFLLCVILVGGIAAWILYTDRAPRGFIGQADEASQPPADAASPPAQKPPSKSTKPAAAKGSAAVAGGASAGSVATPAPEEARTEPASAPVVAAAAAPPPAPPRPFPSVGEISVGAQEDTLMDAYGDPALSAMTSDHGHVIETFVYARDGIRDVTVISLEDGKVSSAYSKPKSSTFVPPPLRRRGS